MPQKKKKYNARFPPGRIKKIMQTDEEVGKVAAAVPIMIYLAYWNFLWSRISRTLELFVQSLLLKTMEITNARQARTLSPSHMRQCIMSENRFDFLRELFKDIPNISWSEEYAANTTDGSNPSTDSMPAATPMNGSAMSMRQAGVAPNERLKRNYQRPMSLDPGSTTTPSHRQELNISQPSSSSGGGGAGYEESNSSGILKKKLLDLSRKPSSLDSSSSSFGGHAKLARLDSSPAAFSDSVLRKSLTIEQRETGRQVPNLSTRRRKSNEIPTLPPTVNLSTHSMNSPIIKIDYNAPTNATGTADASQITPVINMDFSHLISSQSAAAAASNGANKFVLSTEATALATPNLTTPTRLNFTPFPSTNQGSALAVASALEMDEDYDNL